MQLVITMIELSENENLAIVRTFEYWLSRWDWECPVLLGIELSSLNRMKVNWPTSLVDNYEAAIAICRDCLRELLYGANSLSTGKFISDLGFPHEAYVSLLNKFSKECEHFEL